MFNNAILTGSSVQVCFKAVAVPQSNIMKEEEVVNDDEEEIEQQIQVFCDSVNKKGNAKVSAKRLALRNKVKSLQNVFKRLHRK